MKKNLFALTAIAAAVALAGCQSEQPPAAPEEAAESATVAELVPATVDTTDTPATVAELIPNTEVEAVAMTDGELEVASLCPSQWTLVGLTVAGETVALIDGTNPTFECTSEGRARGNSTINRYMGDFTAGPDGSAQWTTGNMATTRKAGPENLMAQEQQYLNALATITTATISNDQLTLASADGLTALVYDAVVTANEVAAEAETQVTAPSTEQSPAVE